MGDLYACVIQTRQFKVSKKMSRIILFFVFISLASLFTSGSALNCHVCTNGGRPGVCGEGEVGTSEKCPEDPNEPMVCGHAECVEDGKDVIIKTCTPGNVDDGNQCIDVDSPGGKCHICVCTTDNCN